MLLFPSSSFAWESGFPLSTAVGSSKRHIILSVPRFWGSVLPSKADRDRRTVQVCLDLFKCFSNAASTYKPKQLPNEGLYLHITQVSQSPKSRSKITRPLWLLLYLCITFWQCNTGIWTWVAHSQLTLCASAV